ncbi:MULTISPECIES: hypothetical protein [unclassified Legionella]|uniref:hypothetical protein n=1 Tax=unclassified Legionella TaxID=2622702 RepID=UPI0010556758|nr:MULTISPECIES: hypothetical protein [unclassified Legionella]MDI9817813.1 hypothetical protein [Legionella sp. PL877]
MPLLTFEDINEDSRSAAKAQFPQIKTVIELNDKDSSAIRLNVEEPIVILGHTQDAIYDFTLWKEKRETVGGLTAKKMAACFDKWGDKGKIKDIYLIACEAGWNDSPEHPCYARQLACELHKKGFNNIKVHVVTSPVDCSSEYVGMRVEMVTRVGVKGKIEGTQMGDTRAFLSTRRYEALSQEVNELETQLEGRREAIKHADLATLRQLRKENSTSRQQIFQKRKELVAMQEAYCIMDVADLRVELNRPENTFIGAKTIKEVAVVPKKMAAESGRVATKRSLQHGGYRAAAPEVMITDEKYHGIIKQLTDLQLKYREKKKFVNNIASLIDGMSGMGERWQQAIFNQMDSYHQISGAKIWKKKDKSTFYDLLVHLVKENQLKRADELAEIQVKIEGLLQDKQIAYDCLIINRAKKNNYDITLFQGDEVMEFNKANEIDFSIEIKKMQARKLKVIPDIEKQASEEPGLATGEKISIEKLPLLDKPQEKTGLDTADYYPYAQNPRRYHFWNEARVEVSPQSSEFLSKNRALRGDRLKGAILENFKEQLNRCASGKEVEDCVDKIKQSAEYRIINTSQGLFTFLFSLKTDSAKAFEEMVKDRRQVLANSSELSFNQGYK